MTMNKPLFTSLFLSLGLIACGAHTDVSSDFHVEDTFEPPVEEASEEEEEAIEEEEEGDVSWCVYFTPEFSERFQTARYAFHNGAARWMRWYPEGDETCNIHVMLSDVPKVAQGWMTDTISGIRVNPEAPITDGPDCEGQSVLLIDVLTHELGHVFGLDHSDCTDCAMARKHYACEPVVPTLDEIIEANRCDDDVPPGDDHVHVGVAPHADCP